MSSSSDKSSHQYYSLSKGSEEEKNAILNSTISSMKLYFVDLIGNETYHEIRLTTTIFIGTILSPTFYSSKFDHCFLVLQTSTGEVHIEYGKYDKVLYSENRNLDGFYFTNMMYNYYSDGFRFGYFEYSDYSKIIFDKRRIINCSIDREMTVEDMIKEVNRDSEFTKSRYRLMINDCQDFVAKIICVLKGKRISDIDRNLSLASMFPNVIRNAFQENEGEFWRKVFSRIPVLSFLAAGLDSTVSILRGKKRKIKCRANRMNNEQI